MGHLSLKTGDRVRFKDEWFEYFTKTYGRKSSFERYRGKVLTIKNMKIIGAGNWSIEFKEEKGDEIILSYDYCSLLLPRKKLMSPLELIKDNGLCPNDYDICKKCGGIGKIILMCCRCSQCGEIIWGM